MRSRPRGPALQRRWLPQPQPAIALSLSLAGARDPAGWGRRPRATMLRRGRDVRQRATLEPLSLSSLSSLSHSLPPSLTREPLAPVGALFGTQLSTSFRHTASCSLPACLLSLPSLSGSGRGPFRHSARFGFLPCQSVRLNSGGTPRPRPCTRWWRLWLLWEPPPPPPVVFRACPARS